MESGIRQQQQQEIDQQTDEEDAMRLSKIS